MALPATKTTSFPGSIAASGEDNGIYFDVPQNTPLGPTAVMKLGVSGTYAGVVLVVAAHMANNSGTTYFAIAGVDQVAGSAAGTGGSFTLTDSTKYLYRFPVAGYDSAEVYASSYTSGTVVVDVGFGPAETVSPPVVNASTTTTALAAATTITAANANALAVGPNGTTNPTLKVNTSAGSAATGISITAAAAASGVAVAAISSGTDENLTVDAKGAGTLTLQGTATGGIAVGQTVTMADAKNIAVNATTGTKIGTATTQKIGFFNATPVVQPTGTTELVLALTNLGLAATGAHPLTLNGLLTLTDVNCALGTSTGTIIGTATTQKLGFFAATAIVQPSGNGTQATAAAGGTTTCFLNTTLTGGTGSSAYTVGDVVKCLKQLGLIAA